MDRTNTPAPSSSAPKKRGRVQANLVDCSKRSKSCVRPSPAATAFPVLPRPAFDFEDDDLSVLSEVSPVARHPSASTYDAAIQENRLKREYELRLTEALDDQEAKLKEDFRNRMAQQKRLYEERIADLDADVAAKQQRLHAVMHVKREATALVQEKSEREKELLDSAEEKDRQLASLQKQLDFERESWNSEKDGLVKDINGWKESAHKEREKFLAYHDYSQKLKEAKKKLEAEREALKIELAALKKG